MPPPSFALVANHPASDRHHILGGHPRPTCASSPHPDGIHRPRLNLSAYCRSRNCRGSTKRCGSDIPCWLLAFGRATPLHDHTPHLPHPARAPAQGARVCVCAMRRTRCERDQQHLPCAGSRVCAVPFRKGDADAGCPHAHGTLVAGTWQAADERKLTIVGVQWVNATRKWFEKNRAQTFDLLRNLDTDADGILSGEQFAEGLKKMQVPISSPAHAELPTQARRRPAFAQSAQGLRTCPPAVR